METHPANNANLIPIMLQFAAMLGPRWPIVLLTSRENWSIPRSLAFRRLVDAKRISIMFLPNGTSFPTHDSVSEWLASSWLWEQFENSDRMLMFQSDSVLCSKSSVALDDFLEWDLIGAPINPIYGQGYNGGLSLRNTKMMLNITRANSIDEKFEDQWFYHQAMALGAKLPPVEVASRFSVETVWAEEPLGYHQPHRWWQGDQIAMIESWCPETLLIKGPGRFHQ
ncbi:hypothetical protein ANO11243_063510 [Dothideomycetidae sp. 11243]|nr:hypothetical protein ANO11243_063510 [fungal sp. No.11243]